MILVIHMYGCIPCNCCSKHRPACWQNLSSMLCMKHRKPTTTQKVPMHNPRLRTYECIIRRLGPAAMRIAKKKVLCKMRKSHRHASGNPENAQARVQLHGLVSTAPTRIHDTNPFFHLLKYRHRSCIRIIPIVGHIPFHTQ